MSGSPLDIFRTWFHAVRPASLLCAADGCVEAANPAARHLFGEDPSGVPLARWTEETEGQVGALLREFAATTQRTPGRLTLNLAHGPRPVRVSGARLPTGGRSYHLLLQLQPLDRGGDAFAALNRELAEVRRRQRQLIRDKARLEELVAERSGQLVQRERLQRTLLETMVEALVAIDAEGRIRTFNRAAEALFGYRAEEVIGKDVTCLMPPEYAREHDRWVARYLSEGRPRILGQGPREVTARARDGSLVPVEITLNEARDTEDGHLFVAALRDIRERKAQERLLQTHVEALERANRELEQFAYVASHDLKAPLRAIANLAAWIEEDVGERVRLDEETRRQFELLRGRVRRMEAFIDGLLAYSRLGRGKTEPQALDLESLLEEIVADLDPPQGFTVTWAGLPRITGDRLLLSQVLANLIGNAVKHHHDPAHGRVEVSAEDLGGMVRITVADDGPGIDPRYHDKVFQIFQTLQARDKREGTGIGLALVKKIVEAQGGRLELDSAPGAGSRFRFTWPKEIERHE